MVSRPPGRLLSYLEAFALNAILPKPCHGLVSGAPAHGYLDGAVGERVGY
jgi:hypothetical protein